MPQVVPPRVVPPSKVLIASTPILPDPAKHVPLEWGVPLNRPATCPTRESYLPLAPKLTPSQEYKKERDMLARACDPPSFDLGFDSPKKNGKECLIRDSNPSPSMGITPVDLDAERFGSDEDEWDETTWKEACAAVDKVENEKGYRKDESTTYNNFIQPDSGFKTPVGVVNNIVFNSEAEGSTTAAERPEEKRRRLIRSKSCTTQ